MTKKEIINIIKAGENGRIEFKVSFNHEAIISISAFANTKGGRLLIGVSDNEITFFNSGKLFGGLTVEDLKCDDYRVQARNKLLAEALYLTRDIEKYGSGFWRIRNYILEYSTMQFEYKEISGGFLTKLFYTKQKITTNVTKEK